jgi:hypothetical protein
MHPSDIKVFIQSVEGRPVWERCRAALEASDIGTGYQRIVHPAGRTYPEFVQDIFAQMAEAPTPYVLRFEDDVTEVNEFILQNITTWPALDDPRFGVGWLFDPGGEFTERTHIEKIYGEPGRDGYQSRGLMHSCAVLFRTADLLWLREYIADWMETHTYYDQAIGYALAQYDRCVVVHAPSLVDHDADVPSLLSHLGRVREFTDTAGGTFRRDWVRPA